jgi:hypothetical protein
VLLAAVLAGYPLAYAGELAPPVALLAGLGVVLVIPAVVFRARFATTAGLCALAAEYVLVEVTDRVAILSIVGYAVGLVILAELLLWPVSLPAPGRVDLSVVVRWLRGLTLIALAAAVLAILVLAAAGFRIPGAPTGTIAAAAAAAIVLALPWLLLRRSLARGAPRKNRNRQRV